MVRTRDNNNNGSLTPAQRDCLVSKSIDRLQYIIRKSIEKYQKTRDPDTLKLAFDCHISLGDILRDIEVLYSNPHLYGHNFELTK